LAAVSLGVVVASVSGVASAGQNSVGLELDPAKIASHVPAGTFHYELTLVNPDGTPVPVRLEPAGLEQRGDRVAELRVLEAKGPRPVAHPQLVAREVREQAVGALGVRRLLGGDRPQVEELSGTA
jgi:hypothetical protein